MNDLAPAPSRRRGVRCPGCGARVTSSAAWCSLCFTDLSAPPPAAPPAAPSAASEPEVPAAVDAAADVDAAERVAELMLAELAATAAPVRRPPPLLSGTGGRSVAMLVGTVVVAALGFGLLALGGALL